MVNLCAKCHKRPRWCKNYCRECKKKMRRSYYLKIQIKGKKQDTDSMFRTVVSDDLLDNELDATFNTKSHRPMFNPGSKTYNRQGKNGRESRDAMDDFLDTYDPI